MIKRFVPGVLALSVLLAVSSAQPAREIRAEDPAYLLKEELPHWTVRAISGQRSADVSFTYSPGTPYAVTSNSLFEKSFETQEWIKAMNAGRVTEVWRSYSDINSQTTTTVDYGQGPQEITTPNLDVKVSQTFMLDVAADGTRSINHDVYITIDETERANACQDVEANLLPGRRVAVGDSWKVPGSGLGLIALTRSVDKLEEADVTATLKSVTRDAAGDSIANLTVKGTLKFDTFVSSGVGADYDTRIGSDASFEGTAQFNITRKRMLSYSWKGNSESSGKMNGSTVQSTTPFTETNTYVYATVIDKPVENGSVGPDAATEVQTFKHAAVDPAHVVIARNDGKIARIQIFDPATKKITKTLLAMPGANSIKSLALSPDRKRLAFSSNLNRYISIADANVFVLELETGKLNQVSPHWATGDGLGKAINTPQTTTVTGRVVWYDNDPKVKRDRSDGVSGIARVDQTLCSGLINNDGSFEIKNVPVGVPLLIAVHGTVPNLSDGKARKLTEGTVGTTIAKPALLPGANDFGTVRLSPYYGSSSYDRPCWTDGGLLVNLSGWTQCYRVNYPQHSWDVVNYGKQLQGMVGGFSASRDGKRVAFCGDSSGGTGSVSMFDGKGKFLWKTEVPGVTLSHSAESFWTNDDIWICAASRQNILGKDAFGGPALVVAIPATKQAVSSRFWPQLAGHSVASLATDEANGFIVTHEFSLTRGTLHGDLWMWEVQTDVLTRMTSLKDVICVASYGR